MGLACTRNINHPQRQLPSASTLNDAAAAPGDWGRRQRCRRRSQAGRLVLGFHGTDRDFLAVGVDELAIFPTVAVFQAVHYFSGDKPVGSCSKH